MKKIIWVHNDNLNIKKVINKSYKKFYSKIDFINQDNITNLKKKISKVVKKGQEIGSSVVKSIKSESSNLLNSAKYLPSISR